jgi:hypothetical protein
MIRQTALALSFATILACSDSLASDTSSVVETVAPAAAAAETPTAPVAAAKPAVAGRVSGTIKFDGEVPAPEKVDVSSDPVCTGMHPSGFTHQDIRGEGGGLADVFVQLTGVPDSKYETPSTPVVLDQVGCTYIPHVFGVMEKQDIKILNSDDTLHNIHPTPSVNREFNVGMPTKGMEIVKSFKKAEDAFPIKCDVHTWMKAWCVVMEHPYYAVTDASGAFAIDTANLPDGEYGVKAWHESLGVKEGKVKVEGGAATYDLSFAK